MIEAMYDRGVRTFVEVGPSATLSGLIGKILNGREHRVVPLDKKNQPGMGNFLSGVGQLAAAGVTMDLGSLWAEYDEYENPQDSHEPKLAIAITGANYGTPYPPQDLGSLAKPNSTVEPAPVPQAAPAPRAAAPQLAAPQTPVPPTPAPQIAVPQTPAPPTPAPQIAAPQTAASAPASPVTAPAPGVLAAYQAIQQQTADAHAEYLRSMAQVHGTFLNTAQQSIELLGQLGGGQLGGGQVASNAVPTLNVASPAPSAAPAVPMAPPTVPVAVAAPLPPAPAPLASASVAPAAPAPTAPAAPAPAQATLSADDLMALLLSVVSDKTGYPTEMLTMEMELEGDLGIDSIKRVEILSAMQDQVPTLPEVDTAVMAELITLGQIVDYMFSQIQATPANQPQQPTAAAAPAATAPAAPAPAQATLSADDLMALLLSVVSDKTGYPTEMLTMEMELEGDLGIDSIKRVEILSAMQDQVPTLPEVDTAVMAELITLGQIVDYMFSQIQATPANQPQQPTAAAAPAATAPAAPAPAQATLSADDLMALLLSVVSDKTGYPTEMLTMEMELEGDLGIDSIKRVEILSAMQDQVPTLPEVDTAVMAELITLGQIVDYMFSQIQATTAGAGSAAADLHTPALNGHDAPAPLGRSVVEAVPAASGGTPTPGLTLGKIAVTDEGTGIGPALVALFTADGIDAALVDTTPIDTAVINTTPPAGYAGLIFLGGLRPFATVDDAVAVNHEAFDAARAFAAASPSAVFVTVSDLGGTFGLDGADPVRAWSAGLTGLARTAAIEWPGTTVRAIDIDRNERDAATIAAAIYTELMAGGDDLEIGLGSTGDRVALVDTVATVQTGSMPMSEADVVVASGGARGVAAATMIELAGESGAMFALLGRSVLTDEPDITKAAPDDRALKQVLLNAATLAGTPLTPNALAKQVAAILANREINQTVAAIEQAGGRARYISLDVTDQAAVSQVIDQIRAEHGPITGVVHGAGVLADKLIAEKTDEQFNAVFNTKVAGLRALLTATQDDPLKLLCLFSSVAARTGNNGQADYAMANEILNKVATAEAARRGPGCVVKSLGWGPWDGGMVGPGAQSRTSKPWGYA